MDAANTTGNVCLLLTLEGTVTRDQLMEQVRRALPGLPMLRRRLHTVAWGLDLPWWVDDTAFDLDRHVVEHEVPEPGGDKAVADLAARLTMIPMDRTRPLWSVHLIHDGSAGEDRRVRQGKCLGSIDAAAVGAGRVADDASHHRRRQRVPRPHSRHLRGRGRAELVRGWSRRVER